MKAIRIEEYGGPDVLRWVDINPPPPAEGEVLVRNAVTGVQFLETRMRRGDYALPLPGGIGGEGAGIVEAVGAGVSGFEVGDRVAYISHKPGAHAQMFAAPADTMVKLPDDIPFERAAASLMKGLTAHMLVRQAYRVTPDDTILVWAAAGGMGQHIVRWASRIGARVIAVVGSADKAEIPRQLGASEVLISSECDVAAEVKALTGEGVNAVYDAIGKDTAHASLHSLAPLGYFVNYGSASGAPDPLVVTDLSDLGSLFYTRAVLPTYIRTPERFATMATELTDAISNGLLDLPDPTFYPLSDLAKAHEDIASRRTTGSLVMLAPDYEDLSKASGSPV